METMSFGEVVKRFNVARSSVHRACQSLGISTSEGIPVCRLQEVLPLCGVRQDKINAGLGLEPETTGTPTETNVHMTGGGLALIEDLNIQPETSLAAWGGEGVDNFNAYKNPTAIADSVVRAANLVIGSFREDINSKRQALQETIAAAQKIAEAAAAIEREQLAYTLRAELLGGQMASANAQLEKGAAKLQRKQ